MNAILILRPNGPRTIQHMQGQDVIETSVAALQILASARSTLAAMTLGAVILEDLTLQDLPPCVLDALHAAIKPDVSCPIATRWTHPQLVGVQS